MYLLFYSSFPVKKPKSQSAFSSEDTASASLYEVTAIIEICEELEYLSKMEKVYNKINLLNRRINSLRNKLMEENN